MSNLRLWRPPHSLNHLVLGPFRLWIWKVKITRSGRWDAEAWHRAVPGAVPWLHVGKGSFDYVMSEFSEASLLQQVWLHKRCAPSTEGAIVSHSRAQFCSPNMVVSTRFPHFGFRVAKKETSGSRSDCKTKMVSSTTSRWGWPAFLKYARERKPWVRITCAMNCVLKHLLLWGFLNQNSRQYIIFQRITI